MKKYKNKNYDISKLKHAIDCICNANDKALRKLKNHRLKGNWNGFYELHIDKDWLLVYRIDNKKLTLTLVTTGTHSKIF